MPVETGKTTKAMLAVIYPALERVARYLRLDSPRSRKVLRIEATYEVQSTLRYESVPGASNAVYWPEPMSGQGPPSLHGVSIYFVDRLDGDGWRLINPLDHDAPPPPRPAPALTGRATKAIPCPTCDAPAGKMCVSASAGKPLSDIHAARRLISIRTAAAMGVERVRKPTWANPLDHLKIDIFDGKPGPWLHLFAPFNKDCNGRDPVDIVIIEFDTNVEEWTPYTGPRANSDEYQEAAAKYEGALA